MKLSLCVFLIGTASICVGCYMLSYDDDLAIGFLLPGAACILTALIFLALHL